MQKDQLIKRNMVFIRPDHEYRLQHDLWQRMHARFYQQSQHQQQFLLLLSWTRLYDAWTIQIQFQQYHNIVPVMVVLIASTTCNIR